MLEIWKGCRCFRLYCSRGFLRKKKPPAFEFSWGQHLVVQRFPEVTPRARSWARIAELAKAAFRVPTPRIVVLRLISLRTMQRASLLRVGSNALKTLRTPARRSYSAEADPAAYSYGPSFGLSEDQQSFQELARDFTAQEIIPVAAEHDRSMKYPWEIVHKAHAAGLMNLHIPEAVCPVSRLEPLFKS